MGKRKEWGPKKEHRDLNCTRKVHFDGRLLHRLPALTSSTLPPSLCSSHHDLHCSSHTVQPQGLCTYCFLCLALSSFSCPHGSFTHLLQIFIKISPSQRNRSWLLALLPIIHPIPSPIYYISVAFTSIYTLDISFIHSFCLSSPLEYQFHKRRDICLFCSLLCLRAWRIVGAH